MRTFRAILLALVVATTSAWGHLPSTQRTPRPGSDEIEVLAHLRERVNVLLALNHANIERYQSCLQLIDPSWDDFKQRASQVPECQSIANAIETRAKDLSDYRVYRSLEMNPIPFLKDASGVDWGRFPLEKVISRRVTYGVEPPEDEDEAAGTFPVEPSPLTDAEYQRARDIFTYRLQGVCARFEKSSPPSAKMPAQFCEKVLSPAPLDLKVFQPYLLQGLWHAFLSDYEFGFRPYINRRTMSLISKRPELLSIRGPETLVWELPHAFDRMARHSRRMIEKLAQDEKDFGTDWRLESYRRGNRDGRFITHLKNHLMEYFRFVVDSDSFRSSDETYLRLLEDFQASERHLTLALSAGVFALNVACLTPAGGEIAAASRLARFFGLFRLAGRSRLACIGGLYVPVNLALIYDSYRDLRDFEEILQSASGGAQLYVDFRKLDEKRRALVFNLLFASADPFVILKTIRGR